MLSIEEGLINIRHGWKEIKSVIKQRYGTPELESLKQFEKMKIRQAHLQNDVIFLKQCKRNKITPKGLTIKNPVPESKNAQEIIEKANHQLIKIVIGENYKMITKINSSTTNLRNQLQTRLGILWNDIEDLVKFNVETISENIKARQQNKLKRLLEIQHHKHQVIHQQKVVVNLSHKQLSANEEKVLHLGLNFALPHKNTNQVLIDSAINIENRLQKIEEADMTETTKNEIRMGVTKILSCQKTKSFKPPEYFKELFPSIKNLKNDPSIVIVPADKGNSTVIMNKEEYDKKCLELLCTTTYTTTQTDPTPKYEKIIQKTCLDLKKQEKISEQEYKWIVPRNSCIPNFYGLPKLHKEGVPMRPIVNFRNSPSYALAQHLNPILQSITKNTFTVKNSYEFVDRLKKIKVKPGYVSCSFDVVSLFTNVPQEDTITYIKQRLKEETKWKDITKLDEKDIICLLTLCLQCSYFRFRENIYIQHDGVPMGSPISPAFANLFMENLETTIVSRNPSIDFWTRYADDTFSLIKGRKIKETLNTLNAYHPKIKFTVEIEKDDSLPFLDVLTRRKDDNTFSHSVYRKSTTTNRYLNFASYHHMSQKISVVDAQAYRALKICDAETINAELSFITSILKKNDYPSSLIEKRISSMKQKIQTNNPIQAQNPTPRFILPYLGPITGRLTHYLRRRTSFDFGYTTGFKMKNFFQAHKDKKAKRSCGVYKIACEDCDEVYVGETGRTLEIRTKEHQADLRKLKDTSAFTQHILKNPNHNINFNGAKIIHHESKYFSRKFKEKLYINAEQRPMNLNDGMQISTLWIPTLLPLLR
jgi:hypothetical protein